MSAQENHRLMQEIFAGLAVGDSKLFVATLHEEVVMRVTGHYSWARTFKGKTSLLRDLYGHFRTRIEGVGKTIPLQIIADDEFVAVEARGDMVAKSGARYDNDYCLVFRLREGKIVEMREYCDSVLTETVLGKYPSTQETN
jgi:ketosteroid isomerase-like protein